MKNKSVFSQIILVIVLALVCILITLGIALFAGSIDSTIFDFRNLNFANMLPVLIIGLFVSCIVVGICILFVSRTVFLKLKDYFNESNDNGGNK